MSGSKPKRQDQEPAEPASPPSAASTLAKPCDDIDELLARLHQRDTHDMNQAPVRGRVADYGQIRSIDLPAGWVESDKKFYSGVGNRSFRMFHPPDEPATTICFYYRGLPINQGAGRAFADVLKKLPHHLSLQELASISPVLSEMKEPAVFAISDAHTEDINGKRVLLIEGQYKEHKQSASHMFIAADESGRVVQEVYFQAPADQFSRHQVQARSALSSINWK